MKYTKFHDIWVRDFISIMKTASDNEQAIEDLFERGYCYHFAVILSTIFRGTIMYNPVENHFATKILVETSWYANEEEMKEYLYDITGRLDFTDAWVEWDRFREEEPLESEAIIAQCIYKV